MCRLLQPYLWTRHFLTGLMLQRWTWTSFLRELLGQVCWVTGRFVWLWWVCWRHEEGRGHQFCSHVSSDSVAIETSFGNVLHLQLSVPHFLFFFSSFFFLCAMSVSPCGNTTCSMSINLILRASYSCPLSVEFSGSLCRPGLPRTARGTGFIQWALMYPALWQSVAVRDDESKRPGVSQCFWDVEWVRWNDWVDLVFVLMLLVGRRCRMGKWPQWFQVGRESLLILYSCVSLWSEVLYSLLCAWEIMHHFSSH